MHFERAMVYYLLSFGKIERRGRLRLVPQNLTKEYSV